ncbi:MAG: RNA-binding S4 domain-containing protein [Vicinamibacterales bacterium]
MRLDVWLDVSCLYRTRSEAQKACKGGKIDVNGQTGRPHRDLKLEDVIEITRPHGRNQKVIVKGLAEQHIAKAEARKLYEDLTPPPSPEELEILRMTRLARPFSRAANAGSPDKRERRELRKMKEGRGR